MAWSSPSLSPVSTVHCPAPFKPLPVISQPTTVAKESSRYRWARRRDRNGGQRNITFAALHKIAWNVSQYCTIMKFCCLLQNILIFIHRIFFRLVHPSISCREGSKATILLTTFQNVYNYRCVQPSDAQCTTPLGVCSNVSLGAIHKIRN